MKVLLTFDVEEFDIPEEFGQTVSFEDKISVSTTGLHNVLEVVDRHDVKTTLFTTAVYAQEQPELIKKLSGKHEIASHGFYHSAFKNEDLIASKQVLEQITNTPVTGFRMARLAPVSNDEIIKAGYRYNSSLNPTWIPGRYNHLKSPRKPFNEGALLQVPVSVTPTFRIPLFWLGVKNFPMWWLKNALLTTLKHDGLLSLYFHPWEFTDIQAYQNLPFYIRRNGGAEMLRRLDEIIKMLKTEGEFVTMNTLLQKNKH
jgi:peptidoglycan/xylan/chitin deacetylase (PgdA/CDA1 family)